MFYNATLRRNVRSSARRKASPDAIADELANKRVSDEADGPGDEIRSGLDALAEATQNIAGMLDTIGTNMNRLVKSATDF
jgi:hypothetical protein